MLIKPLPYLLILSTLSVAESSIAAPCSPEMVEKVLETATEQNKSIKINCDLSLDKDAKVSKQLIFEGTAASNTQLHCNGASIDASFVAPSILISSKKSGGSWQAPEQIIIKDCQIANSLRIQGLGTNGEAKAVRESSVNLGHTQYAQDAAPHHITLENLTMIAGDRNMMYFAPGVHHISLKNSKFIGRTTGLALYLDAETAYNTIENNYFDIQTKSREVIAVDGSAHNVIQHNQFKNAKNGAIFLYRNCGEGGTIRHQTPSHNKIVSNTFIYTKKIKQPVMWFGSRNGNRNYCAADQGYGFGSSQSDLDYAEYNLATQNHLQLKKIPLWKFWEVWLQPKAIRIDSLNNQVSDNQIRYR